MFSFFSKPFRGGIHPAGFKELTANKAIDKPVKPKRVYLSLQQRNGTVLTCLVKEGEAIGKGQLIARGTSDMAVPLHSPVNGVVEKIAPYLTAHPSGLKSQTIQILANDDNSWAANYAPTATVQLSPEQMIQRVLDAGIVGLGGAGFPTGVKMRLARQKEVHTLLINGGECEPYLTCDDRLMQEKASEIISGVDLMQTAIGAKQAIIAIEDNKPASMAAMREASAHLATLSIVSVPSLYPMGSERHLIKAVTGKAVPPGELSLGMGILVHNVATARAVYHAIRFQRPLIDRVITVSGGGIENPKNLVVPIGTPVNDLLTACGGLTMSAERLITGGPMMGQVIPSPYTPIDKSIGALLALSEQEVRAEQTQDCVRCGRCVEACPMGLMPFQMAAMSNKSDYDGARDFGLDHCLLCGACAYVCPSRLPLVQSFSHARGQVNAQRSMTQKSTLTRQLTEARQRRLEKEAAAKKAEKAERAARKKRPNPRRQTTTEGED